MAKEFLFDTVIPLEDFCNRSKEKKRIFSLLKRQGRLVIYSKRRMGKTSLVHACVESVQKDQKNTLALMFDFNAMASMENIAERMQASYEAALKKQLPIKQARASLADLFSRIKISVPGDIELSLQNVKQVKPAVYLQSLFDEIETLSHKHALILVCDEFQGIEGLVEAQVLLRREFLRLAKVPILLLGSNQRLLYTMFSDKKLPFYSFGEDLELGPIPLPEYLPYIAERLEPSNLSITADVAEYWMLKMNDIPNYINELGAWIVDQYQDLILTKAHIDDAVESATESKKGRYHAALYPYAIKQRKFIQAIARLDNVARITGKEMQATSGMSPTELGRLKADLEDCPLISIDAREQWYILDPFFKGFLERL